MGKGLADVARGADDENVDHFFLFENSVYKGLSSRGDANMRFERLN